MSDLVFLQPKKGEKLELAQVIAPYEATSKEQLTLVQVIIVLPWRRSQIPLQGTMIVVKKKTETGWWQGEQVS